MVEKFRKILDDLKKKQTKDFIELDLKFVQNLFTMQDINKDLKLNAINEQQLERALSFEKTLDEQLKKLYVPNYQIQNT